MSTDIPIYAQSLCQQLLKAIAYAPLNEIEAVRKFLIEAAKGTIDLEIAQRLRAPTFTTRDTPAGK